MSSSTFAVNVSSGGAWDDFSPLSKLVCIATVNNKARFEAHTGAHGEAAAAAVAASGGERKVLGDATDAGLLRFCDKIVDVDNVRAEFMSVFTIPFNSKNKWALNMVGLPGDPDHLLVMIKGAPEYVLKRCTSYLYRDGEMPMNEEFLEDTMDAYESFGTLAERVIGHAYKVCACFEMSLHPATLSEECQGMRIQ
jgi:magnesium-transporting ATPase (P-type)